MKLLSAYHLFSASLNFGNFRYEISNFRGIFRVMNIYLWETINFMECEELKNKNWFFSDFISIFVYQIYAIKM